MTKPITLVRPAAYFTLRNVPVYGELQVTPSSSDYKTPHEAMQYALDLGTQAQSLGIAIVVRAGFHGDPEKGEKGVDDSDGYQRLSTIAASFRKPSGIYTAFIEVPNTKAGIAFMKRGYDAHATSTRQQFREHIVPLNDPFLEDLIAQSEDQKRVVPALIESPIVVSTEKRKGRSEYGQNQAIIAAVGSREIVEVNASYLNERGFENGSLYSLTASEIEGILAKKQSSAVVRPLGLGGDDCNDVIYYVNADATLPSGLARGYVGAQKNIHRK